ncbi:F0F1-type ATP synthase membrane subunit c/vacuolar-type H+-ATPase subunit K [Nocardioides luteus]|uniref:Uncharacterized protein n=1 Tax=Nocardioides luteus TaxID=1844 RepID=A0ABQ5SS65_9ACTN|nr:hypothetical protein [Nocardioides luteus]MDR7311212.1 F0F1-type ATP synthase membrane subunit c/vacuolar-type H+-ATPase subunit K [Nocardioides luteus]GGR63066.1 hypothetical protein GCM10010197_33010 [Nocardioides luteus]GLJ66759.1 hypothetical protein GCM10017579_07950 [Nocardioides luteus]
MPTPVMRTAQMLSLTFMSMLVVIGVVVALSIPEADLALPAPVILGGQVIAGIVVFVLCSTIGFRTAPIAPGTPQERAETEGIQKQQTSMFLRLVLSEIVALGSLALAFLVEEGQLMTYAVGGVISLLLMIFFAYPSARNIRRVEAGLDSAGARSRLSESFGVGDGPTSTHQVL